MPRGGGAGLATHAWHLFLRLIHVLWGAEQHCMRTGVRAPLAGSHCPCSDDPERDGEDQQHRARTDGHEGLHHEARVEVDLVERADAPRRGVREELAVQQHDTSDEVQPQEHGDGQDDVHVRVRLGGHVGVGQARRPGEGVVPWDGMDGAHQDLQADEEDALVGHGYPPVIGSVVHHE